MFTGNGIDIVGCEACSWHEIFFVGRKCYCPYPLHNLLAVSIILARDWELSVRTVTTFSVFAELSIAFSPDSHILLSLSAFANTILIVLSENKATAPP